MVKMIRNGIETDGYVGLSTEAKPVARDGSKFLEVDTDKYFVSYKGEWTQYTPYILSEEGRRWCRTAGRASRRPP